METFSTERCSSPQSSIQGVVRIIEDPELGSWTIQFVFRLKIQRSQNQGFIFSLLINQTSLRHFRVLPNGPLDLGVLLKVVVVSFKSNPGPLVLALFPWKSSLFLWIAQKDSSPLLRAWVMLLWGQEKLQSKICIEPQKSGCSYPKVWRFKRVGLGFKACLGKKANSWFSNLCLLASLLPRWWQTPTSVPLPASWRACPRAAASACPPSIPPRILSEFLQSWAGFWAGERCKEVSPTASL